MPTPTGTGDIGLGRRQARRDQARPVEEQPHRLGRTFAERRPLGRNG
jgi:hypothetical protein